MLNKFRLIILFITAILILSFFSSKSNAESNLKQTEIRILSFNMKFEKKGKSADPLHTWDNRKDGIAKLLVDYRIDIVGTQELKKWQYDELKKILGKNWSGVGEARDGGEDENNAIIYNKKTIKLIEEKTLWLSETPEEIGSKSWNSSKPRIVTYGKFIHLPTNKEFYLFNTHLDHKSNLAREKGLKLILEKINILKDYPIFLTGDFNMSYGDKEMESIFELKNTFPDTFLLFEKELGVEKKTTHGFYGGSKGEPIDFIFYSKENLNLKETKILREKYKDIYYLSDHYPVYSSFNFIY